jgi:hypothetical protein
MMGPDAGRAKPFFSTRCLRKRAMFFHVCPEHHVLAWLALSIGASGLVLLFNARGEAAELIVFFCRWLALKVPETGDLMIVGDGSQSLYRKRDFTWADAGIHASGRVINRKFDLDRNYRNTVEILRAARAFSVPPGNGLQGVLALPVEPDTAIRSRPELWLIRLDDAASEMHYAAALIETWLRGDLEIGGTPACDADDHQIAGLGHLERQPAAEEHDQLRRLAAGVEE